MTQDIFIIGANGNVGRTLVEQIFDKGDADPSLHKNPTRIVGLASISAFIYDENGISEEKAKEFSISKDTDSRYSLDDVLATIKESNTGSHIVFVDVTAARDVMKDFHVNIIQNTPHGIATSNKNPLAMVDSNQFLELTKHSTRYGFRCTVMAGANGIDELKDFQDLNDPITKIEGCFSGTLGYICSELETGKPFSEIVKSAKEEGYTEPHPAEDLSGKDVAKKLLILARTAGLKIEMSDIQIEPFIPEEFLEEKDISKFLDKLVEVDTKFESDGESDLVLRYVASLTFNSENHPVLTVGPKNVPRESPLGMLSGTSNKVVINSDTYSENEPCIIEAPGAGLQVTAQNIRRDLLQQLNARTINFS